MQPRASSIKQLYSTNVLLHMYIYIYVYTLYAHICLQFASGFLFAHWLAQSATANGPAILDKAFGESGPTAFAKWSGGQFQ